MPLPKSSESHENYLKHIGELIANKGYARVTDIAGLMKIRPASVTIMVKRLEQLGFVKREHYRGLSLTAAGEKVSRNVATRHDVLVELLELLGLSSEVIEHDVDGLEHHLSDETLKAMRTLVVSLKRQKVKVAGMVKRF
ncbi:MAG: iron dependent repressor, metal binding and dimerization domain protein [bacterium]